jgi:glycogen synthase
MKICYISFEYPNETHNGGIAAYTWHTARAMATRGHNVHVIACTPAGQARTAVLHGVTVHLVGPGCHPLPDGRMFFPIRNLARSLMPRFLNYTAWARSAGAAFRKLDSATGFDIVEFPDAGGEGAMIRSGTCKRVVRLHMSFSLLCRYNRVKLRWWDRWLIRESGRSSALKAHAMVSPSKAYQSLVASYWNVPQQRIHVLPNLINSGDFTPSENESRRDSLVVLGRIEPNKGIDKMIRLFGTCKGLFPNIKLRFIGRDVDLYEPGYLGKLIEETGLRSQIEFTGHLSSDGVKRALAGALGVLVPSEWENFPYSCLESMAMGRVVFGTRNGGIEEIIRNGHDGFVVDFDDFESVKVPLRRIATDAGFRRDMERAARRSIEEKFDAKILGPLYETFYGQLLELKQ